MSDQTTGLPPEGKCDQNIEKALRMSEAMFEALFKYSPDAILGVNEQGIIMLANQQACEVFGYAIEELVGAPVETLIPDEYRDKHRIQMADFMAHSRVRPMGTGQPLIARGKDGNRFPVDITLGPVIVDGYTLVLATIRDITERKLIEQELSQYREHLENLVGLRTAALEKEITERKRAEGKILQELEQRKKAETALQDYANRLSISNQELQDFAFIASHDLNEPLRKIQVFGGLLQQKYNERLGNEGIDYLNRMLDATVRMRSLLEGLLAYSRVTTQAKPMEPVDLNKVMKEVVSDLEVRIERTGGKVEISDLPLVHADEVQMHQLFQNLIANALKFHTPGVPPVVKVYSNSINSSSQAEIIVEDNGIGFEEDNLGRIFEPFQRLHNRIEYEGSGIGLAICHKIVARHGGSITAHSQPGKGARFIVRLPRS